MYQGLDAFVVFMKFIDNKKHIEYQQAYPSDKRLYCRKQDTHTHRCLDGLCESCDNKVVSVNNVWVPISSYWKIEVVSPLSILMLLMVLRKTALVTRVVLNYCFFLLPTSVFISSYTLPLFALSH